MKNKILPVFIPFAGCKNKCIFCNQHSISGIKDNLSKSSIINQIETYLKYSNEWQEIAYYGGSFSCLEEDKRLLLYNIAKNYNFNKIRFSTRPDCIDNNLVEEFLSNGVKTIELGIQSTNNEILIKNKRPYLKQDIFKSIDCLKENFKIGIQLMPGIYGDTFEIFTTTIKELIKPAISYVRIYPCCVYKNTELEKIYKKGIYKPLNLKDAIILSAFAYVYFEANNTKIIRVGLPYSSNDSDFIVGPTHNSFGDLVKTYILILFAEYIINSNNNFNIPKSFAGYKSVILKNYPNLFYECNMNDKEIWKKVISTVKEIYFENNLWYLQKSIFNCAEKIQY